MLKVGVTGGIGSGKSVVCRVFATLGIPVFNADDAARYLMENDAALIGSIKAIFGDDVYADGPLNRHALAYIVFHDPGKLNELNALVHPATIRYAQQWLDSQKTPYAIKEAAIFFESGSNKDMDIMIGVSAPQEIRIQRAMERSNMTHEQVQSVINNQMNEDEKMALCNYVIVNDGQTGIIEQVMSLHQELLKLAVN